MNLCGGFEIRALALNLKFLLTNLLSIKEYFKFQSFYKTLTKKKYYIYIF